MQHEFDDLWYLHVNDRRHFVDINGSSSSLLPVIPDVPQGSILKPLLFLTLHLLFHTLPISYLQMILRGGSRGGSLGACEHPPLGVDNYNILS